MKSFITTLVLISLFGINLLGQSVIESSDIILGQNLTMKSKILNKDKSVLIHIPKSYNSEKEYPLVFLLDFMAFNSLASITEVMGYNKTIENCIIVCPVFTNVREEYSPTIDIENDLQDGMKTIKYFENELLPYISSKYKISKKILWGQSYSGMFSTFVMLQSPHLFDAYFSDLPNLNLIETLLTSETVFANISNISNKQLYYYVSSSSLIKEKPELKDFLKKLKEDAPSCLKWSYTEIADSIAIAHISSNYIYALSDFLKSN